MSGARLKNKKLSTAKNYSKKIFPIKKIFNEKVNPFVSNIRKSKIFPYIIAVLLILGLLLVYKIFSWYLLIRKTGVNIDPWGTLTNVIKGDTAQFDKDENGYTNFLLVGIDTRPDGEYSLTDTIMVVSYNNNTNAISMISIPRDTVVIHTNPKRKNEYDRINTMYIIAETYDHEDGLKYLSEVAGNYVGLKIHYAAMINLKAFEQIVDTIGGVDVYVENAFVDTQYPTYDYKTETIRFAQGWTHLDGATALKYARSRHGAWPEGTDYARGRRQQNLIKAIKDKISNNISLQNVGMYEELVRNLGNNLKLYNISVSDIPTAFSLLKNKGFPSMDGIVLDPSIGEWKILREGNIDFVENSQYAITPIPNYWDYSNIHVIVSDFISNNSFVKNTATIYFCNGGYGYSNVSDLVLEISKRFPYKTIVFQGNCNRELEGFYIDMNPKNDQIVSFIKSSLESKNLKYNNDFSLETGIGDGNIMVYVGK